MGWWSDCCGLCTSSREDREREPLLQAHPEDALPQPTLTMSQSSLKKTIDILAALYAGKLPSQEQTNRLLQLSLSSELLSPASKTFASQGRGPISRNGQCLAVHMRDAIEAFLRFGEEKNWDDLLQELVFEISHFSPEPLDVKADTETIENLRSVGDDATTKIRNEAPTRAEVSEDTSKLLNSIRAISILLLSSTTFRLLLADAFQLIRELIARVAKDVEGVAQQVQVAAEDVEQAMNVNTEGPPLVRAMAGEFLDTVHKFAEGVDHVTSEPVVEAESGRDKFVSRVQELIYRAHQDPQTLKALRDLLDICRKYSKKYTRTAKAVVSAEAEAAKGASGETSSAHSSKHISISSDKHVVHIFHILQTLLERLASGHSLGPFLSACIATTQTLAQQATDSAISKTENALVVQDPDVQHFLRLLGRWFDAALAPGQPSDRLYATSRSGTRSLEKIYDTGKILYKSSLAGSSSSEEHVRPDSWVYSLQEAVSELGLYLDALSKDETTTQLITSLSTLRNTSSDFISQLFGFGTNAAYGRGKASIGAWKEEILQDVVGWLLPHLLRLFGGLQGMAKFLAPRVEFKMKEPFVEGAVDTLTMVVEDEGGVNLDLVPDRIVVKSWNEVRFDREDVVDLGVVPTSADPVTVAEAAVNGVYASATTSNGAVLAGEGIQRRTNVSSTNKIHIHLDGIRFGFSNLGYFARVQAGPYGLFGYEDQGLISVHIGDPEAGPTTRYEGNYGSLRTEGERTHEGLGVDVGISMDTDTGSRSRGPGEGPGEMGRVESEPIFEVEKVKVSLPARNLSAMKIRFDQTRHWILNKVLVQPLAGPVVGKVLQGILEDQVRGVLEGFARMLGRIREESERMRMEDGRGESEERVGVDDWVWAAVKEVGGLVGVRSEEEGGGEGEEGEGEEETETVTRTETTWKGVVHTRTTIPTGGGDEENQSGPVEEVQEPQQEIAIAVGVGTQLFPDEAGPYGGSGTTSSAMASDAPGLHRADATAELDSAWDQLNEDVQDVKRQGHEAVKEVNNAVEEARETVEMVHERWEEGVKREEESMRRRGVGRKRGGWRSKAFDV